MWWCALAFFRIAKLVQYKYQCFKYCSDMSIIHPDESNKAIQQATSRNELSRVLISLLAGKQSFEWKRTPAGQIFFESMFIGQNAGCIWFICCWVLPHFMAAKGMSTVSFSLCSLQGATRSRFEGLNAKPGARLSSVFHWRHFSCDPGDFSLKASRRQRIGYVIHMNFTMGWFQILIILIFSRKKGRWCNSTIIPWVLLTSMTTSIQLALMQICFFWCISWSFTSKHDTWLGHA